ncbi:hypothetical protein BOX15_Mlig002614g1, partial [Macrostomum lignano]
LIKREKLCAIKDWQTPRGASLVAKQMNPSNGGGGGPPSSNAMHYTTNNYGSSNKKRAAHFGGGNQKRQKFGGNKSLKISPDTWPEFRQILNESHCHICNSALGSPTIAMQHFNGQKHRRQWALSNPDRPNLPVAVLRNGVYYTSNMHDLEMARANAIDEATFLKGVDVAAMNADPDMRHLIQQRHCSLCGIYFSSAMEIRGHLTSPNHLANTGAGRPSESAGFDRRPPGNHVGQRDGIRQPQNPSGHQTGAASSALVERGAANANSDHSNMAGSAGTAEPSNKIDTFNQPCQQQSASMETVAIVSPPGNKSNSGLAHSSKSAWQTGQSPIVCGSCNIQICTLAAAKRHYESAEHLKAATAAAAAAATAAAAVAAAAVTATPSSDCQSFRLHKKTLHHKNRSYLQRQQQQPPPPQGPPFQQMYQQPPQQQQQQQQHRQDHRQKFGKFQKFNSHYHQSF